VTATAITFEMVEAIAKQVGGGAILDESGVRGALGRPFHGSVDEEYYPTIWEKAAVLLHGFATTQYLEDGNKRTAWTVAKLFLLRNGLRLPPIPAVQSEALMHATSAGRMPIERVAEWLRVAHGVRTDEIYDHRLEYLILASAAEIDDTGSTMSLANAGMAGNVLLDVDGPFAEAVQVMVCGRILWGPSDDGFEHAVTTRFIDVDEDDHASSVLSESTFSEMPVIPSGHRYQRTGRMPALFCLPLLPVLTHHGAYRIELLIDGQLAGTKTFTLQQAQSIQEEYA
jgi:prophage maintenance system killer protein